jgi:hypothetical protein
MFKNLALLAVSVAVAILLGEGMVRMAVDSDDFLNPYLRMHRQFKTMISPNSTGHDRWGFRNDSVPQRPDIVTIGDSFAYGYLAPKATNWPSVVGRQTGLSVYNVSMGAWGPSQYACAMKVYAAALKPKFVVISLYLGNDVGQAATEDYPCDELDPERISAGSEAYELPDDGPLRGFRTWLSHNSVLYQAIKTAFNGNKWFARLSLVGYPNVWLDSWAGTTVALRIFPQDSAAESKCDLGHGVTTHKIFDWVACDAQFEKGTATTIERLTDIQSSCERIGTSCLAVLIPSKESLYYPLLSHSLPPDVAPELEHLWRNEEAASHAIAGAFAHTTMPVVDSEPDLRKAISAGIRMFSANADPHFNAHGYAIVAALVSAQLRSPRMGAPVTAAK